MLRLLLVSAWLVQLAFVLLLADTAWVESQMAAERERVGIHFGATRAEQLEARARESFDRTWIATGVVERSYARLLPDPLASGQGRVNIAPWFFAWMEARIDAFWLIAYQLILRLLVLREWFPLLGVAVLAAMLDGYVQQRIKRAGHALASADRYLLGRKAGLLIAAFPLFYVITPVMAPPSLVPAWGLGAAITCRCLLAHAQHRI